MNINFVQKYIRTARRNLLHWARECLSEQKYNAPNALFVDPAPLLFSLVNASALIVSFAPAIHASAASPPTMSYYSSTVRPDSGDQLSSRPIEALLSRERLNGPFARFVLLVPPLLLTPCEDRKQI